MIARAGALVAGLAVLALVAACGGPTATSRAVSSAPVVVTSPVDGVVIDIEAEGFSKVRAFTIRTADGTEQQFTMGVLENGAQFPPSHLAEHMATSSVVRVYFREENGALVVYRIEDAPAP